MFRALLSVVAVLLLAATGFLVYSSYLQDHPNLNRDTVAKVFPATPPAPPPAPAPAPAPVAAPTPPAPVPAPVVEAPRPAPVLGKHSHVVASGDSLWTISRRYYGSPDYHRQIAEANALKAKDRIRVGQVLLLPEIPNVKFNADGAAETDTVSSPVVIEPMPPTLNVVQEKP